jgi:hypothetical protein
MTKRLVILLAALGFSLTMLNGCTSKESKDDAEIAAETADATAAGDTTADGSTTTTSNGDDLMADALPEESLDSNNLADATPPAEAPPTENVANNDQAPPQIADSLPSEPAPSEPMKTEEPKASKAVAEMPPPPSEPKEEKPAPVAAASLQKVSDSKPWKQGGQLLNTVYIARPGDTVASISQTIYGSDKTKELKKANPKLKSREPKPSEKVFYNSPLRPDDSERMLTYFEDNGIQPETYVAKKGDTIKKVAKNLLGYDNAWKEMWSTNAVDSKGKLEEGTELRYWKQAPTAVAKTDTAPPPSSEPPPADMGNATPPPADMAGNAPAPPPDMGNAPPPPPDMAGNAPPPPPDMNGAPPPPPPDMASNDLPPPPPPPPPPDMAAPPPPPPPAAAGTTGEHTPGKDGKKHAGAGEEGMAMDEDTMMALGVIAVAALALGGLLIMRKKRKQRELESAFSETHVGT